MRDRNSTGELISIVVPVYNVEKYLRECLESILKQTYQNLEIILVDDGSTDCSGKICDDYAGKDRRIAVVHQKNQGVLAARNTGIKKAHGRYIGFVDGDDWVSEQMYWELYHKLKKENTDLVICKKNIYDDTTGNCFAEGDVLDEGVYATCKNENILFNMFTGYAGGEGLSLNLYDKLFSRKLILENYENVDRRLRYFEDVSLALFCMLRAEGISVLNQPFYFYRQRKGSLCHSLDLLYLEQVNIFFQTVYQQVSEYSEELFVRLSQYIAERSLFGVNYMMGLGLQQKIPYYVPPFEKICKGDTVVIYGAGEVGKSFYRFLKLVYPGQIVMWVDMQYKKLQEEGFQVYDPADLKGIQFEKLIIAVKFKNNAEGIKKYLTEMGIMPEKIIWEQPKTLTSNNEDTVEGEL